MKALDRYEELINTPLDQVIMYIKNGKIAAGRYSNITKSKELKSLKELIENVTREQQQ